MVSTTPRRRREQHAKERRARRHLRTWSCVNRISLDSENEPRFLTAESTVMRASMARMRRPRFVTSTQLGINSAKPITDAEVPSPPAPDPEPEVCDGENYPFETPPDTCESNSFGTCCSWSVDSSDGGVCRHDYCTYHESQCEWTFILKDCE